MPMQQLAWCGLACGAPIQVWPWTPGQPPAALLAQCRRRRRRLLPRATWPVRGLGPMGLVHPGWGARFCGRGCQWTYCGAHGPQPAHACWPPCMWPVVGGIARGAAWGNACPPNALPNAAAAPVKWWLCPGWWAAAASTTGSAAAPGWRPLWRQVGGVWLLGGVGVSPHMRPLASSGLRLGCGAPQRCPGTYTWATGPAAHTCGPGGAMCCSCIIGCLLSIWLPHACLKQHKHKLCSPSACPAGQPHGAQI